MPESICLHIQDREAGPIRVVEIPWISVRIGCAAYCEVRLTGHELAEEVCRLQRRGRTWRLFPLGTKGSILLGDRSIEEPCPLPFDVPFRVGSICFTLRQNNTSEPDWEVYRTLWSAPPRRPVSTSLLSSPLPVAERPLPLPADSRPRQAIVHEPSIPSPPRVDSLPGRLTSTQTVNPWEARWKAAGAQLQVEPQTISSSQAVATRSACGSLSERPAQGIIASLVHEAGTNGTRDSAARTPCSSAHTGRCSGVSGSSCNSTTLETRRKSFHGRVRSYRGTCRGTPSTGEDRDR